MATTTVSAPVRSSIRSPLALWHLLSLDAATVAGLWCCFAARCFGVTLPWTAPAALALAVWMLYVLDRIADAARGKGTMEERHRFHGAHRVGFAGAVAGGFPLLILLLAWMPRELRDAWMLLALPLAVYVAAVHVLRLPRVPKEHLVAVFFAATVLLPELLQGRYVVVPAGVIFGALCWLNCAAIAKWERAERVDRVTAWCGEHLAGCCVALGSVAVACSLVAPKLAVWGFAVAISSALVWILRRLSNRFGAVTLRALADATLLTPLLFFLLRV